MDYLDPEKKRSHRIRLYIGYGLLTIAVAIATVILVYIGNGFYVDRNTGALIQNGQLFVNSAPDGAKIFLNGREQRAKTAGRFVVPSGSYTITIKRDGYRDWVSSKVILDGGTVKRLDYARLLPATLKTTPQQTFASSAYAVTESTDRRYLALQFADQPLSIFIVDLTKPESPAKEIKLVANMFVDANRIGQLQVAEWADDNKHLLLKNVFNGAVQDYLLVSRDAAAQTLNLRTDLRLPAVELSLHNRKFDRYYAYDTATKTLGTIDLGDKVFATVMNDVTAYKTYGDDSLLYATAAGASTGKIQIRYFTEKKSYLMREVAVAPSYLLALGRVGNAPAMAFGVANENKVTVIRDPLTYLRANPKQSIPLATTVMQMKSPTEVSFSTDMTVVMTRSGQDVAVHAFEEDSSTSYTVAQPLAAAPLQWVDGKHLSAVSGTDAYMFDFNGENMQKLAPSIAGLGVFFDNSYQSVYTFTAGANGKPFNVNRSLLLAEN